MRFYTCDRSTRDARIKYYVTSKLSENIHATPEGYLVCIGVPIARTGEMIYGEGETPIETDEKGRVKIQREEEEVFRPETIASFEGKAITISHPVNFVGPENWKDLAKGVLQNVRRGEGENKDDLIADLLIMDKVAIDLVKNGLREVSCGYSADYDEIEDGKGIQKNIIGNHLALVQEGRAGAAYAINDHKGKGEITMSLKEKIKGIFAKAQDEAIKAADEFPEKKDDKAKDAADPEKEKAPAKDASAAYDELVKICTDLAAKIDGMKPGKDEAASPAKGAEGEKDVPAAKDADPMQALEERLKSLEAQVAQLLSKDAETEMGDEDKEEMEDDDFEETTMTGDSASRAEILMPGTKAKDEAEVLKAFAATAEGKKIIDSLTGNKGLTKDSSIETLFVAASELVKAKRTKDFAKTKTHNTNDFNSVITTQGPVTAEDINKKNTEFYKTRGAN